jgi:hypothetical protein
VSTPKLVLGRHEIAEVADTSLSVVDDAIREGHLKSFLMGRKRKSTPQYVAEWVLFLQRSSDAGKPINYRARPKAANA